MIPEGFEKKLFFLVVLLLIGVGVYAFKPWSLWIEEGCIRTTVTVFKGEVNLYGFDREGNVELRRVVREGETAFIETVQKKAKGSLGVIRKIFPEAMTALAVRIRIWAGRLPDDKLARFVPEGEIQEFLAEKLGARTPFSEIRMKVGEKGFEGSAYLKLALFETRVKGRGVVGVDRKEGNRLYLRLYEVRIGLLKLPAFLLREWEDTFSAIFSPSHFPLRVLELEYQEGGVLIYAVRRQVMV